MKSDQKTPEITTFSALEAKRQKGFSSWRERLLEPILKRLDLWGVDPDTLSVLGILVMLLLPLAFLVDPLWAFIAYGTHVLLDGLDGSLARFKGLASPRGAYLDVVVDHFALIVTVLVLQWFNIGHPFWVLLYTSGYLILLVHFVLMNAQGSPPPFPVLRSKYILFLFVILFVYRHPLGVYIDKFFLVFGCYYAVMTAIYIILFRWSLPSSRS